jgi:hypothetical protein
MSGVPIVCSTVQQIPKENLSVDIVKEELQALDDILFRNLAILYEAQINQSISWYIIC